MTVTGSPTGTNTTDGLSAAHVRRLAKNPDTLLVDVRPRWRYRQSHVPDSHSIPAGLLLSGELPEGDLLLVGTDSKQSVDLIERLYEQGYNRRIQYLEGGFTAWVHSEDGGREPLTDWSRSWQLGRQLVGGPVLLLMGGVTQSLGLLALGLVVWLGPWVVARSRA